MFLCHLFKPFLWQIHCLKNVFETDIFQSLKGMCEGLIEPIKMAFVFHHCGARQKVEVIDIIGCDAGLHALQKAEIFA